jgi:truncated hemoglobin YjbI
MIVADLPYNPQFEEKLLKQVNKISQQFGDVKIYRKDLNNPEVRTALASQLKANIRDQTLFLLKNPYEKGASNIDFDIFMQFPHLLGTYLKDVQGHDETNVGAVT